MKEIADAINTLTLILAIDFFALVIIISIGRKP